MSILPKSKGTAKAYISGVGMVTPVGVDANMTTAIIKAGIMPVIHVDFVDILTLVFRLGQFNHIAP